MIKNSLIKILNLTLKAFDFDQRRINLIIEQEIEAGGQFEKLVFPIKELNQTYVIQFFKTNSEYGMVSGLGADKEIEMAYLKAIVEYFERLAFFKNEKTHQLYSTNGIAAHRIKSIAKKAAEDEVLERDSFLRHWYSNTPFISIRLDREEEKTNKALKTELLEIFLGKTYLGSKETVICFLKDNKTNGFALGLSSGRDHLDREKAIQEALINYFFGHQGVSIDDQILTIKKEGIRSLQSHRAFWLYMTPMPNWLFADTSEYNMTAIRPKPHSEFLVLEDSPFCVYRCINNELIELLIGDVCKFYPEALTKIGINVVLGPTQYHPIP